MTTCCPPSFQLDGVDLKRRAEDQGIKCSQTRTDDDCYQESVNLPKGVVTATAVDDKYCHFVFLPQSCKGSCSFISPIACSALLGLVLLCFPGLPKILPLLALGT